MPNNHTTSSGETWDMIAYNIYGNSKLAGDIIQANLKYSEYVIFPAGIELILPDISDVKEVVLPPWRLS